MLRTEIRVLGETVIIKCEARVVAGEEIARLKNAVLCHQDSRVIEIDLQNVEMMDGSGLGLLAFLAGWTRVVGTELRLLNPSRRVRELLPLTRLDSVLDVSSSEPVPPVPGRLAASCLEHR